MAKYFGVENELVSLRSKILIKDNEIAKLNSQLKGSGLAIPEEASDLEDGSPTSSGRFEEKKGPPSPDQEL